MRERQRERGTEGREREIFIIGTSPSSDNIKPDSTTTNIMAFADGSRHHLNYDAIFSPPSSCSLPPSCFQPRSTDWYFFPYHYNVWYKA